MAAPFAGATGSIGGTVAPWYNSPLVQGIGSQANALIGLGSGLLSQPTFSQGLAAGGQGYVQGAQADTAYATSKAAEKQRLDGINATVKFLQSNPATRGLVPLAQAGQGAAALTQAFSILKGNDPKDLMKLNQGDVVYDPNKREAVFTAPEQPGAGSSTSDIQNYEFGKTHPDFAAAQGGTTLTPEAVSLISDQYLAGDKSVITGYGKSPEMRAQISNAIAAKATSRGIDGKTIAADISAYGGNVTAQKAAGTRAAQVGIAASEANQMAGLALTASKDVPRGAFVPWTKVVQAWQSGNSSPELAKFAAATTSLVNAYARAVSPVGAPTDAQRQHAEEMLNTAQSPEAYAAVIDQMKQEMEAALNAPAEVSDRLKTNITGEPSAPSGGAQPLAGKTSSGLSWSLN